MNDNDVRRLNSLTVQAVEKSHRDFGEFDKENPWRFLVSDYYSNGEGRTICLMVTQGLPCRSEDYNQELSRYSPVTTKDYRSVREFHEIFGEWHSRGVEFFPEHVFFSRYEDCLPPILKRLRDKCYHEFHSQVHFNFS